MIKITWSKDLTEKQEKNKQKVMKSYREETGNTEQKEGVRPRGSRESGPLPDIVSPRPRDTRTSGGGCIKEDIHVPGRPMVFTILSDKIFFFFLLVSSAVGHDHDTTAIMNFVFEVGKKVSESSPPPPPPATESLVHSLISSRLDFGNGLLYNLPNLQIAQLQKL